MLLADVARLRRTPTQQTPNRLSLCHHVACAAEMAAYVECEFVCVGKKREIWSPEIKREKMKEAATTNTLNQLGVLQGEISSPTLTTYRSSKFILVLFILMNN